MNNQYDPNALLVVPVEDIGQFTFAMRSVRNQFKIEVEYSRLTGGLANPTPFLGNLAQNVADIACLVVNGPPGWSSMQEILDKDAFEPEVFGQIQKIWSALSDKEAEFRGHVQAPARGEGTGEDGGDVVPPEIQPAAD